MTDSNPGGSGGQPEKTQSAEREIAREAEDHRRMAIDNDTGVARPDYDQYAVNDPESTDKPAQVRAREAEIAALDKREKRENDPEQEPGRDKP